MRQNYAIAFLLFFVTISFSCKKNKTTNSGNAPTDQTYTAAYVAPTLPGILNVSQTQITVKAGTSFTTSASLFNPDGSPNISSPTFVWNLDNSSLLNIATSNLGSISTITGTAGNDTGLVTVSVTDGTHGYAYIYVHIVSASTAVSSSAFNISFSQPLIVLKTGATTSFTNHITDQTGNANAVTPSYIIPIGSGISISGNNITAGTTPGLYIINAVSGTDTLQGGLSVLVYNGTSTAGDTTWAISGLVQYPFIFFSNNLVAKPIIIQVTGYSVSSSGQISVTSFQTSPDQIEIDFPSVITVENGLEKSVTAGVTSSTIMYKGAHLSIISSVIFVPLGCWGDGNGTYFDLSTGPTGIYYTGFYQWPIGKTYFNIKCDSLEISWEILNESNFLGRVYTGNCNYCSGLGPFSDKLEIYNGYSNYCNNFWNVTYKDSTHMVFHNLTNKQNITLTKGNCSVSTGSLYSVLSKGGSCIWIGNFCSTDNACFDSITFGTNTVSAYNTCDSSIQSYPYYTYGNKYIIITDTSGTQIREIDTLIVKSFTNNKIVFDTLDVESNTYAGADCVPEWSTP